MTLAVNIAQSGSNNVTMRNRIINGAMTIDQRNAGASVTSTTSNPYTLDRYIAYATQSSKFTVQQNAGSVTPPAGFTNYLGITSSSAYSVLSTDFFGVAQYIEGFNTADLNFGTANAATVTLSFWVRSSLTGTFASSIANSAFDRSYPYTYTINAANTWEYKTITIPGDTSGTWVGATNGNGLRVYFNIGAGSNWSGTAGAWAGAGLLTTSGATSVVGTSGATFYITGVQLEKGTAASPFENRLYGTELQLCQRYYYRITAQNAFGRILNAGLANSSTLVRPSVPLPTPMRASVSAVDFGGGLTCYDGTAVFSVSNVAIDVAGINTIGLNVTTSGTTGKQTYQINDSGSGGSYIGFSAEL
jgi:hypothetical protein